MSQGIYCYIDKKTNKIVYIGKDSYIDEKRRDKAHKQKSRKDEQPFNRILQNNLSRYEYKALEEGCFSRENLNELERKYIAKYNPKFNFTEGGDGGNGGRGPRFHSPKTREKISLTQSKQKNSSGFYRVYKHKNKNCKQGFTWEYLYRKNGKKKAITCIDIEKLEEKVRKEKLPWIKF